MVISIVNDNSVDPDQTPHFAASDLGLHCLPMPLLWDAGHKWVNRVRKKKYFRSISYCLQNYISYNGVWRIHCRFRRFC